jgi:hypothetical protein
VAEEGPFNRLERLTLDNASEEDVLNYDADTHQGTAVMLLDARGQQEAADLLEIARMSYRWAEWEGVDWYRVILETEIPLLPSYTDQICDQIGDALATVHAARSFGVKWVLPVPLSVGGDWRVMRRQARLTGITNQGTLRQPTEDHPVKDGLRFRSAQEVAVYDALKRAQERLPPESTILIAPNAGSRIRDRNLEVDFIVAYRGRVGAIEVDGPHHGRPGRRAADKSKDDLLRDAGVAFIERIPVEDTRDTKELDLLVQRFLNRLTDPR